MLTHHVMRASFVIGTLAALAACADAPISTGPNVGARLAGTIVSTQAQSPGGGEFWLCKEGNAAGTFTFDYAIVNNGFGPDIPGGSIDVAVGSCVLVASTSTDGQNRYSASVTEHSQTNWTLTSITLITSGTPDPTVDVPNRTASNIRFGNDGGTTVTFTNVLAQGCSPGYYKTHLQPDRNLTLGSIFANTGTAAGSTLQAALDFQGGSTLQDKKNILLRQAAAAYFNIGYLGNAYPLTLTQLVTQVNAALASGDKTVITDFAKVLDGYNNLEGPNC